MQRHTEIASSAKGNTSTIDQLLHECVGDGAAGPALGASHEVSAYYSTEDAVWGNGTTRLGEEVDFEVCANCLLPTPAPDGVEHFGIEDSHV